MGLPLSTVLEQQGGRREGGLTAPRQWRCLLGDEVTSYSSRPHSHYATPPV